MEGFWPTITVEGLIHDIHDVVLLNAHYTVISPYSLILESIWLDKKRFVIVTWR